MFRGGLRRVGSVSERPCGCCPAFTSRRTQRAPRRRSPNGRRGSPASGFLPGSRRFALRSFALTSNLALAFARSFARIRSEAFNGSTPCAVWGSVVVWRTTWVWARRSRCSESCPCVCGTGKMARITRGRAQERHRSEVFVHRGFSSCGEEGGAFGEGLGPWDDGDQGFSSCGQDSHPFRKSAQIAQAEA